MDIEILQAQSAIASGYSDIVMMKLAGPFNGRIQPSIAAADVFGKRPEWVKTSHLGIVRFLQAKLLSRQYPATNR